MIKKNLKSRFIGSILGLTAILHLSSCLDNNLSVVSDIQQDFDGITEVEVEGAFLDVSYIGEDGRNHVSLDAVLRANSDSRYTIDYHVEGSKLVIEVDSKGGILGSFRGEGYIRLRGPKMMELDLEAGSGGISASDAVSGAHEFSVGSGNIQLSRISGGFIDLDASSGNISGQELSGKVDVEISSGNVTLQGVEGDVDAKGSSGQIKISDANGLVNTSISSGKIELERVKLIGKGHLSSGNFHATNSGLGAQTDLKASSGNIFVQTASDLKGFNFNITAGSGFVRVGNSQSSGSLVLNNGSSYTIRGEVTSGKIEIVN